MKLREAFRPFLGLKVPLVQETVVRDVTLSNKIEGMNRGLAVSDVSSGWCLRLGPPISRD